jgi:hemerythrin-like domain-containing protein
MSAVAPAVHNPISIWHSEHMYFKRLLDVLHDQVEVFETGEKPNYELMLDIIMYLREYSDRFHHPREDVAFARLARHRPELERTLARLRQEHRVIAIAGDKLQQLITTILDDAVIPRTDVEAAAATYLAYYGNHIAREEADVMTHAARALTPEDWAAVAAVVPPGADPLHNETTRRYRELRRRIALES